MIVDVVEAKAVERQTAELHSVELGVRAMHMAGIRMEALAVVE